MNPCDSASVSDLKQANILFLTKQNGELFEKLSAEEGALAALMRMHSTLTGDLQSAKSDLEATNRKCHSLRVASARATEAASDLSVDRSSLIERNSISLNIMEKLEQKTAALRDSQETRRAQLDGLSTDASRAPDERLRLASEIDRMKQRSVELEECVKSRQAEVAAVRQQLTRTESQTAVDIELINSNLGLLEKKNAGIVDSTAKTEQTIASESDKIGQAKSALAEVIKAQQQLREDLDSVLKERAEFVKERTLYQQKLQQATNVLASNKALLAAKEQELQLLAIARREQDMRLREFRDREYGLLDQVRQGQVELTKLSQETTHSRKKLQTSTKTVESAQARLGALNDSIAQLSAQITTIREKNRESEQLIDTKATKAKTLQLSQLKRHKELEDIEKLLTPAVIKHKELSLQVEALEQQRSEQTGDLDRSRAAFTKANLESARVLFELNNAEDEHAQLVASLNSLIQEANRIKRLNADARRSPALIQSDSSLLDRLQINVFLKHAQSSEQPIPLLIEKIAELVCQVGDSQNRADLALSDLQKRNAILSAQRNASVSLCDERMSLSQFKQNSVVKFTRNELETDASMHELCLDALMLESADLSLVMETIRQYKCHDRISNISLRANHLDDTTLPLLAQILYDFSYLSSLDLRENVLSESSCKSLTVQLRSMDGITGVDVIQTQPGSVLEARSGKLKRISIDLRDQAAYKRPIPVPVVSSSGVDVIASTQQHLANTDVRIPEPVPTPKVLAPTKLSGDIHTRNASLKPSVTPAQVLVGKPVSQLPKAPQVVSPYAKRLAVPVPMSSRESVVSDASFVRQLDVSRRQIKEKATRLGIKSVPFS